MLLPETTSADAVTLAERLRMALANRPVAFEGAEIRYTCSFGVSERRRGPDDLDALMRRADQALYRAKDDGRNCVRRTD